MRAPQIILTHLLHLADLGFSGLLAGFLWQADWTKCMNVALHNDDKAALDWLGPCAKVRLRETCIAFGLIVYLHHGLPRRTLVPPEGTSGTIRLRSGTCSAELSVAFAE